MALYPCSVEGHRYAGPQSTIYPAVVNGVATLRTKLRLCPQHFRGFVSDLEQSAENAQLGFEQGQQGRCLACGEPTTNERSQFFATVYAPGKDREDFWAPLHDTCAAVTAEVWHLDRDMAV